MNKTKFVLSVFAVFASLLMVMSAAMARPVQEKATNNELKIKVISEIKSIFGTLPPPILWWTEFLWPLIVTLFYLYIFIRAGTA